MVTNSTLLRSKDTDYFNITAKKCRNVRKRTPRNPKPLKGVLRKEPQTPKGDINYLSLLSSFKLSDLVREETN